MKENIKNLQKISNFILILAFLSNSIFCINYVKTCLINTMFLMRLTYAEKQFYIEKFYRYLPAYEYSQWINRLIPDDCHYSLYAINTNYSYYYAKLNYFLYPKYIETNVANLYKFNNNGKLLHKNLQYGNLVFAIALKQNDISKDKNTGLYYTVLNNNVYYIAAKHSEGDYLLVKEAFLKNIIILNPGKWNSLLIEFKILYPEINLYQLKRRMS